MQRKIEMKDPAQLAKKLILLVVQQAERTDPEVQELEKRVRRSGGPAGFDTGVGGAGVCPGGGGAGFDTGGGCLGGGFYFGDD